MIDSSSSISGQDQETSHLSASVGEYASIRISRTMSTGSDRNLSHSLSRASRDLTEPPWLNRLKVAAVIFSIAFLVYIILLGIQDNWLAVFEAWATKHKRLVRIPLICGMRKCSPWIASDNACQFRRRWPLCWASFLQPSSLYPSTSQYISLLVSCKLPLWNYVF